MDITERENEKNKINITSERPSSAIEPGILRVIKRNGSVVNFDISKIEVAITKAFLAVHTSAAAASSSVQQKVNSLAKSVQDTFSSRMPSGGTIHIEEIQDQVELALMRSEELKVARAYVVYRAERTKIRQEENTSAQEMTVLSPSERTETIAKEACEGLSGTNPETIIQEANKNLYEGASEDEIKEAMILSARSLVEAEPNYTYATSRILLDSLRTEALSFLNLAPNATQKEMENLYPQALDVFIKRAIELELVNPELGKMDLKKLGNNLKPERDLKFSYLGLQTLYDRYFIHKDEVRFELPQIFFMRVAMGLAIEEENREERAIEFYNLLSSFDYMSSTPTLFNSGTIHSQLSSCYLTTVPDDLKGIYDALGLSLIHI